MIPTTPSIGQTGPLRSLPPHKEATNLTQNRTCNYRGKIKHITNCASKATGEPLPKTQPLLHGGLNRFHSWLSFLMTTTSSHTQTIKSNWIKNLCDRVIGSIKYSTLIKWTKEGRGSLRAFRLCMTVWIFMNLSKRTKRLEISTTIKTASEVFYLEYSIINCTRSIWPSITLGQLTYMWCIKPF